MCRNPEAQTQNMTMYGNGGRLWWLLCAGSERMVLCITVCLVRTPWENMFFIRLFFFFSTVPAVGDTASGCLVFTVPVHAGTTRGWSPELRPCSTCCRSYFTDAERVQKKKPRGGSFSPGRHGRTRLCNGWHSGEEAVIEDYMGAFGRCVHVTVARALSVCALTPQAQWR